MERTITKLELQKNDPNRINIYLDDEFAFGISRFVGTGLKHGQKIEESQISSLLLKDTREKAFQKSLYFINYQPRTIFEVQEKLEKLGFEQVVIADVLEELIKKNYLNDKDFAVNWVESRCRTKPRSRKMLDFELKKKSISDVYINYALKNSPSDDELAISLGKKYLRRFAKLDEKEFVKKMTNVLARRVFPFSIINTAIVELEKIRNEKE